MKVKDLIKQLSEANPDDEVLVADYGYFGGTMNPTTHGVEITHVYIGFDWDMGKTYIMPYSGKKGEK